MSVGFSTSFRGLVLWIEQKYRTSFWVSCAFHVLLIVLLALPTMQQAALNPGMPAAVHVVHAQAVTASDVAKQVQTVKARERAVIEAQQRKVAAVKAAKQRQLQQARLRQQRIQAEKIKQQQAAKAHALAVQRAQEKAKQQQKIQALAAQSQQLQKQQQQDQLAQEQQQLQQYKQQVRNQGVIDQYRQQIAQSIGSYWLISRDVDKSLSCKFLIRLAPGGVVLKVSLLKSSGNSAFDRSAQVAVYKASPLPVPKDSALFNQFREFSLIVSPKTVMIRSSAT